MTGSVEELCELERGRADVLAFVSTSVNGNIVLNALELDIIAASRRLAFAERMSSVSLLPPPCPYRWVCASESLMETT